MTALPSGDRFFAAMDTTWPAAQAERCGPFTIRRGEGGGKRVSATSTTEEVTREQVETAARQMQSMGQDALFMLRAGNERLDVMLEGLGYAIVDPVLAIAAPIEAVSAIAPPLLAAIPCEMPLEIMRELWAAGGVGAGRLAVMARAKDPKTYLFSRTSGQQPAGCAFVAVDGDIAMLHALEVAPDARRSGAARAMMGRAALWGQANGARVIAVVTTGENLPAQQLFAGIGMQVVDRYHYRLKKRG